jgi:hypothetical protein
MQNSPKRPRVFFPLGRAGKVGIFFSKLFFAALDMFSSGFQEVPKRFPKI